MKTFPLHAVISFIDPESRVSPIDDTIQRFIVLEERLNNIDDQSEYFRWGLASRKTELEQLQVNYQRLRAEFNAASLDALISERNELMDYYWHHVIKIYPIFVRIILAHKVKSRIYTIEDFLFWKKVTHALPDLQDRQALITLVNNYHDS